jgi:S-adenosylmethionine:tRNA ribosyltransferase-isomerase
MTATPVSALPYDFRLPAHSEATGPPESRGLARDAVRLLVARPNRISHHRFRDIVDILAPGDLLVVNTSGTLPAAVQASRLGRPPAPLHVASLLDDGSWVVELRLPDNSGPDLTVTAGESLVLAGGLHLTVEDSYPAPGVTGGRLWRTRPATATAQTSYLLDHGQPIRYGYLSRPWPLGQVQTVYAQEPGSAEMPSAGRPFTQRVLVALMARGVAVAPIVLHTGVSSPEKLEPPIPERFQVPAATARLVNATREGGGRIVAVGTTATRALESATEPGGTVTARRGWTDLILGPERPAQVVSGLVTGLHEPAASHLLLLEAVAGRALVDSAYRAAVRKRYLWHEFGDSMLFMP